MSSRLPDAVPCPDKPPLHLKGGYLLVAAPEALDEACISVPAVRALKYGRPQGTLTLLCPEEQRGLWQRVPQVDHIVAYPPKSSVRQIAGFLMESDTPYDSAIMWELNNASKAIAKREVLQRLGYPAKGMEKLLTDPVHVVLEKGPVEHRVRHYMNLVEKLGVEAYTKNNFEPAPLSPPPGKPMIALAPASAFGSTHQWPNEKFVELVEHLEQQYGEIAWVVIRESDQKETQQSCEELVGLLGDRATIQDHYSIENNLNLLESCSGLVASDSHAAHLAAHIGLPAAVIFGPNEPEWKRPLGKQNQIVREHVACSPCYLRKCPLDLRCQGRVSVERVASALMQAVSVRYGS